MNPDAGTGVATLSWQAPTKDANGEPLTDLQAYMVLYGRSPDDLKYWKRIVDKSQTSFVVTGLGKGVWYFSIVAINSHGGASAPSQVVSKEIQ
jgi:hypothetical protein